MKEVSLRVLFVLLSVLLLASACSSGTEKEEPGTDSHEEIKEKEKESQEIEETLSFSPKAGYTYELNERNEEGVSKNGKIVREVLFEENGYSQHLVVDPFGGPYTEVYYEDESGLYRVLYEGEPSEESVLFDVKDNPKDLLLSYPLAVGHTWNNLHGERFEVIAYPLDVSAFPELSDLPVESKGVTVAKVNGNGEYGSSWTYLSSVGIVVQPDYYEHEINLSEPEGDFFSLETIYEGRYQGDPISNAGKGVIKQEIGENINWEEEGYEIHFVEIMENGHYLYQVSKIVEGAGRTSIYDVFTYDPKNGTVTSERNGN